jgi:hypothetical protein
MLRISASTFAAALSMYLRDELSHNHAFVLKCDCIEVPVELAGLWKGVVHNTSGRYNILRKGVLSDL